MEIMSPSFDYEMEFGQFYDDFVESDKGNAAFYKQGIIDFSAYIQSLLDAEQGINIVRGYTPCYHYWLIDHGAIIGAIRIRYNIENNYLALQAGHIGYDVAPSFRNQGYGTKILALALPLVRKLGIETAIIVADENNIASRKIIEANGGYLKSITHSTMSDTPLARYHIDLMVMN